MGFEIKDKIKCLQTIKSVKRQNFKTKVLTRFRVVEKKP